MKEKCFDSHKVCTFSREMDFGEGMIGRGDSWSLVSFWKPWKLVTRNQPWHAIINHQSWSCQYSFGSPVQPRWIGVLSNFARIYELYFRWIKVPIIFTFKSSIVPNQVLLYSTRSTVSFPIILSHLHKLISSSVRQQPARRVAAAWETSLGPWTYWRSDTRRLGRDGSGSVWDVWDILVFLWTFRDGVIGWVVKGLDNNKVLNSSNQTMREEILGLQRRCFFWFPHLPFSVSGVQKIVADFEKLSKSEQDAIRSALAMGKKNNGCFWNLELGKKWLVSILWFPTCQMML